MDITVQYIFLDYERGENKRVSNTSLSTEVFYAAPRADTIAHRFPTVNLKPTHVCKEKHNNVISCLTMD